MIVGQDIKLKFLAVKPEDEFKLLEEFLLELTFAGRAICVGDKITREEQLTGLKQINEINHIILSIISNIRNGKPWLTRENTWDTVCEHVKLAPHIAEWVGTALIRSLQSVNA